MIMFLFRISVGTEYRYKTNKLSNLDLVQKCLNRTGTGIRQPSDTNQVCTKQSYRYVRFSRIGIRYEAVAGYPVSGF